MENTEIMNYEDEAMVNDVEVVETEESGMSTGTAMLIGAGLTFAIAAVVKLAKEAAAKVKAKKELKLVAEGEVIEPTDEQIEEVTK